MIRLFEERKMSEADSPIDYEALRRLRKKHAWMLKLLILSLGLLFGGLALYFLFSAWIGWLCYIPAVGMLLGAVAVVLSYPFGKTPCPRCKKPYYVPSGFWGYFCKVNLLNRTCYHCGLALDAQAET